MNTRPITIVGFMRDPRTEPKPGDVIEGPRGQLRAVITIQHSPFAGKDFITYKTRAGAVAKSSIDYWRAWSKQAVVMKVAR